MAEHVHVHIDRGEDLARLDRHLNIINENIGVIMADLSRLNTEVAALSAAVDAAVAKLGTHGTDQAAVDAAADSVAASRASLETATNV